MSLSFLPLKIQLHIDTVEDLYEIRLRKNYPVVLKYSNKTKLLKNKNNATIICTQDDIDYIIENITEHSLYAFNNYVKNGYLTTKDGLRVGIAGECVYKDSNVVTIKNFSSLNIRIPHNVLGCANEIFTHIYDSALRNTLIISPPLLGKTTILKDLIRIINEKNLGDIMVIDERNEFSTINGINIDKISGADKLFAFTYGIRSLAPSVIITDELSSDNDWKCVTKAISSGVYVIASCHGNNINFIKDYQIINRKIFDRYVLIDEKNTGKIKCIYDENFNVI